ncbi:MAG: class I tRNA ligase family protein, partial [bacterium]|nr:class I tRNA ligase family protein [bacterium]
HRLPMEFSKKMGWHESIVPQIFKRKRNTYRLRDHKFEIGDQVAFENSQTGEIFGYGIITDIKRMQVSKANLKDKTHFATYENVDELIAALKRQNPNLEVTKDTQMFIYSYDFLQPDVLDTWFSSALWPFATLGWPEKTRDLEIYYPTQVLSTARDIINLWVARMIFSSEELLGKPPFSDIIIHATIMAKSGQRMSKSLGTGVDPMDLVGKYGADATRFGLVWQAMGTQDIKWAEEHVVAGRKFLNKIWNASRFVLGQLEKPKPKIKNAEDKKILAELKKVKKEANQRIEKYEFGQALHALHDFFWHKFCDRYLEESKKNLNPEVLLYVLADSLKLLHPFLPFITEKIWEAMPIKDPASGGAGKKLLMIETWPR